MINNTEIGKDISIKQLKEQGYSAIFLGIGAEEPIIYDLQVKANKSIITSTDILYSYSQGKKLDLGKIAIIGGGNVAMDTARVATRMNSKEVYIIYRRNRKLMPARDIEIEETERDGVKIIYNTKVIKANENKGKIDKIICTKTKAYDNMIIDIENSEFEINVDTIAFAIGFKSKTIYNINLKTEKNLVKIGENGETNIEGIFAGGDLTENKSTVCRAIKSGKKASIGIENYLQD